MANNQEPGYAKEDVSNKKIALYGLISILIFVILFVMIHFLFLNHDDSLILRKERPYIPLKELHAHEDSVLFTYRIIDASKGLYRIPVDSAINLIEQEKLNKALDPTQK